MSSPRLASAGGARQRRRADREQRQAADLVQRLGAVEQLEQARHDVDRDAVVAADADAAQQLLVAGPREGDDDPVDLALVEHLVELVERAELRQPLRAPSSVWTSSSTRPIVSRPNSPWRSSRSASRSATRPEPTITVRWRSGATLVRPATGRGRGRRCRTLAVARVATRAIRAGVAERPSSRGDGEYGPGEEQCGDERSRRFGEAAGPGAQVAVAVEAEDEGEARSSRRSAPRSTLPRRASIRRRGVPSTGRRVVLRRQSAPSRSRCRKIERRPARDALLSAGLICCSSATEES